MANNLRHRFKFVFATHPFLRILIASILMILIGMNMPLGGILIRVGGFILLIYLALLGAWIYEKTK